LEDNLICGGRGADLEGGGADKGDLFNGVIEMLLGQEEGSGGPANFTKPHETVTGGANRRISCSENLGQVNKSVSAQQRVDSGTRQARTGGVYSDGPRLVYNKLVNGPILNVNDNQTPAKKKQRSSINPSMVLPSASLRKKQQLARSINSRKSLSITAASYNRMNISDGEGGTSVEVNSGKVAGRKSQSIGKGNIAQGSFGSTGISLGSSSINSSDIRNCNRLFLKNYEQEVASKVWNGALLLGVEENPNLGESSNMLEQGNCLVVDCIKEIQVNEKRDEEESIKRERLKSVHQ
jgi:hypothetical protein